MDSTTDRPWSDPNHDIMADLRDMANYRPGGDGPHRVEHANGTWSHCGGQGACYVCEGLIETAEILSTSTTDPHEAMAQAWATGVAYFEVRPPNAGVDNTRSEQVVSTSNQSPPRSENFRQNRQDER